MISRIKALFDAAFNFQEVDLSARQFSILRRNISVMMLVVAIVPLLLMTFINHYQYYSVMQNEMVRPVKSLLNKTKHTFELFLAERRSAVNFIASAYSYEELSDQKNLSRVFRVMREEFGGFVDLGVIDSNGVQVSYVGPYELTGKNYSSQSWFQEVKVRGEYTSDVFLGYRKFPHFVIAVMHRCETGVVGCWTLRATIDTHKFDDIISSMGLEADSDAFIINREGVLQTTSKYYGNVLEKASLDLPPVSYEPAMVEALDEKGREVLIGYVNFLSPSYVLMVVKPKWSMMKPWASLKADLLILFLVSTCLIFVVVLRLTGQMVRRIEKSDQKRRMIDHEMQYTNKLASIGRLAAGVAHEINNPLAIINEKAGLMKDLIHYADKFEQKDRFMPLIESILKSVDRCRTITHRLLGFARRMDVAIEIMDINELLMEVLSFLEKEALHRNIQIELELDESLVKIESDQGQLQQVFLNILNNAFAAVQEQGVVKISTWELDQENIVVAISDNGYGMSEETLKHIFEPFYTTRKGEGTGLGLSITYGIVKKLGGQIEVQSRIGHGTTFTVFLPKQSKGVVES